MTDEIRFASVKDAVRWAEEVATLPDVKSSMSGVHARGGSRLSSDEVRDIAFTVCQLTAQARPWAGVAAKAVWGMADDHRPYLLGHQIAKLLCKHDWAREKGMEKLRLAGEQIVLQVRDQELHGKSRSLSLMARKIGVSPAAFTNRRHWLNIRQDGLAIVRQWLDQANHMIWTELEVRGWV